MALVANPNNCCDVDPYVCMYVRMCVWVRDKASPWANFEVDWRNPKNPLSPKWQKGIPAKVRINLVCVSGIFIRL